MLNLKERCPRSFLFKISLVPLLFAVLTSCKKGDSIGLSGAEVLNADVTDTVTLNSSTLLLDSLPTAGKGVMLAGHIDDPQLGGIRASSYFQVAYSGASAELPEGAKFDSVRLKLQYSGYYYGDTSVKQVISVHQLSERIKLKPSSGFSEPEETNVFSGSSTFYNVTKFDYDAAEIGRAYFKARPASKDSLMIRLSQSLGAGLFSLVKNNSSKLSSTDDFLDYFKGLVLVPGNEGNSVIGYTDTAEVKLYYSYLGTNGLAKKGELKFSLYENNYQFNSISADRSASPLKDISLSNHLIPASSTSGRTYIQGGIGLVTKIEIPYIAYLSARTDLTINKAELTVEVPGGTGVPFKMPGQLVLLVANKSNKPVKVLTDANSNQSALYLNERIDGWGNPSYSIPLTSYVRDYVKDYQHTSLLLSLPVADLQSTMARVILGSPQNSQAKIKLKITYTKLNL